MAQDCHEGGGWHPQRPSSKIDEELEFFTELALHETERWIQVVTKKKFQNPEDPRKSLENGVLFCELLNSIKPGSIKKINKLPTPIAGLDNLQVFLEACQTQLGLRQSQLFDLHDLEDLSTRAVADDEELLRAEYDRRLRNVALTVYWLGKTAKKVWDGPQLDFSAFSDLVNRTGVASPHNSSILDDSLTEEESIDTIHLRQESADSGDRSSAYGSLPSKTSAEEEDLGIHHTRENSIESLVSCEGNSDKLRSAEMPGRYPEDNWGKGGRYSAVQDALYDENNDYEGVAEGEQFSREDYDRFRFSNNEHGYYSSGDSADPQGGHSRQSSSLSSSSRGEYVPPTRVADRRANQPAVNPLQFIAVKPKEDLTVKAKETIEVMEKQKKEKTKIQLEEEDWQSNLSSWKSKMRRKSAATFERAVSEEPELVVDDAAKAKVKSFKEMVENKPETKRRTFNIYPYGDEDEDAVFSSSSRKSESSETTPVRDTSETREVTSEYRTQRYEADEYKPEAKSRQETYGQTYMNNGDHTAATYTSINTKPDRVESDYKPKTLDITSRYPPEKKFTPERENRFSPDKDSRFSLDKESRYSPEKDKTRSSPEKVLRDPPKKLKDRWPLDGSGGPAPWQRQSPESDRSSKSPSREEREGSEDRGQRISLRERMEKLQEKQSSDMTRTEVDVRPNKLSSLRSAFESQNSQDDHTRSSAPKRVIRNMEDIPSFKETLAEKQLNKSPSLERDFDNLQIRNVEEAKQKFNEYNKSSMDYTPPRSSSSYKPYNPPESNYKQDYSQDYGKNNNQDYSSNYNQDYNQDNSKKFNRDYSQDYSKSYSQEVQDYNQDVSSYSDQKDRSYQSYNSTEDSYARTEDSYTRTEDSYARTDTRSDSFVDKPPSKDSFGYSSMDDGYQMTAHKEDYLSDSSETQSSNIERKNYVEKTIKIKIPPANPKGFGFTIKGGKEHSSPILVEKVRIGTAADVCELLAGDEIIQINGAEVAKHYKESVELVIDNAVKVGLVDLKVRRYLTQADIFDDDEFGTVQRKPDWSKELPVSKEEEEHMMQNGWGKKEEEEETRGEEEEKGMDEELLNAEEEERLEMEIMARLEEEERMEREMEERHRRVLQDESMEEESAQQRHLLDLQEQERDLRPSEVHESHASVQLQQPQHHPHQQQHHHQLPQNHPQLNQQLNHQLNQHHHQFEQGHQNHEPHLQQQQNQRHLHSLHVRLEQTEAPSSTGEEDLSDTPPALPSQPPPAPNWSTFPGAAPQGATDISFLDSTDLVPDSQTEEPKTSFEFCGITEEDLEEATRAKISMLRRRSDFLGVNLDDMEEYKKLQEDFLKEKEEEEARKRQKEEEERERQKRKSKPETSGGYSYGSSQILEQQEKEILETLEKEEAQLRSTHLDTSRSLSSSQKSDEGDKRSSRDMSRFGRSFFNQEDEQRRMQQWAEEQEKLRQPEDDPYFGYQTNYSQQKYSKEQEEMRQQFMADLKRSEEVEAQKKEQEAKLLEKELAHQRELEALAIKQQEERERRKIEAEEERKREIQERKRQEIAQKRLLEEQQIQEEMELKNRLALRAQEIELNQDATTTIQQLYPWRAGAVERRSAERELAKKKQEREQRVVDQESREVQIELEKQRARMEEMKRLEEEDRKRYEEEKRRREEEETKMLQHKEDQLRLMEEKIKYEAEKLRQDREFLIKEKEEQERIKTAREQELAQQQNELRQKQEEIERMQVTTQRDDYSQPLQIDTGRNQYDDSRYPQHAGYDSQRQAYDQRPQDVQDGQPIKPAPKQMPIQKKPLNLRRDGPLPAPKPSANLPRQPNYLSRNEVLEMNKRPGATDWNPRPPQVSNSTEEIRITRPTIEYKLQRSPKKGGDTSPTRPEVQAKMRDESRVLNRRSWGREASPGVVNSMNDYQPSDIRSISSQPAGLPSADMGPTRKIYPNSDWKSEDDRQAKLSDNLKAAYSGNLGQHWVIQEAERRRLAEAAARSQQQPAGYASDMYPAPTHVMEHSATPEGDRPSRPIPDSIKQTLIQRVNSPKSPGGSSPSYPPGHLPQGHIPSGHPGQYSGHPEHFTSSPTSAYSQSSGYHSYENNRPSEHQSYDSRDWSPGYDQRAYDQRGYDQQGYNPGYGGSPAGGPPQGYNGYEQNRVDIHHPQHPAAPAKPPRSLLVKSESGGGSRAEQVVSVDGHQHCSGCDQELGQGEAMIIESLNLYYHLPCFRCCVCHAPLGQGHQGADVRVRVSKLHCQNCYSNDEVGLKYSQV